MQNVLKKNSALAESIEKKQMDLRLGVEEDRSEVDKNKCFQFLENEKWGKRDYLSGRYELHCNGMSKDVNERSLEELVQLLKMDVTRVITFSNSELELVANASLEEMRKISHYSFYQLRHLQKICLRWKR